MKFFTKTLFPIFIGGVIGFFLVFTFFGGAITGHSMEPTLRPGDWRVSVLDFHPEVGDIISFWCGKRCEGATKYKPIVQHRLTSIEPNGCMHIEGDNQPSSWDTKDYGCLMPNEVFIFAKSYPIDFLNN